MSNEKEGETITPTTKRSWQIKKFDYDSISISYPDTYYQFIKECFIFDVYRSYLIEKGDLVVDLGAGIGEFSILASRKVGKGGIVVAIEPNTDDFKLLNMNIKNNHCQNIIATNIGAAEKAEEKEMYFWGRTFKFKTDTLSKILDQLSIHDAINFLKIDIEGYELKVISKDIDIIRKANVISLELHNTKEEIDKILLPHGFFFEPIVTSYCIRKMFRSFFFHPRHFFRAATNTLANNPSLGYKLLIGYNVNKQGTGNRNKPTLVGSYIKRK
jgi:FkbM family methyltransferase